VLAAGAASRWFLLLLIVALAVVLLNRRSGSRRSEAACKVRVSIARGVRRNSQMGGFAIPRSPRMLTTSYREMLKHQFFGKEQREPVAAGACRDQNEARLRGRRR